MATTLMSSRSRDFVFRAYHRLVKNACVLHADMLQARCTLACAYETLLLQLSAVAALTSNSALLHPIEQCTLYSKLLLESCDASYANLF